VREKEDEFYRRLAECVKGSGVREVALVGGLDESLRNDDSRYRVVMTSTFAAKGEMQGERVLEDDKMIVGPVASLLNFFEVNSFPAFAVLAYSRNILTVFLNPSPARYGKHALTSCGYSLTNLRTSRKSPECSDMLRSLVGLVLLISRIAIPAHRLSLLAHYIT
jgi:hypothetical protein